MPDIPDKKSKQNPLRFGIMVNSSVVEQWQSDVIDMLVNDGHILCLVVVNGNNNPKKNPFTRLFNYPYKRFVFRMWNRFFFQPKSKKPVSITSYIDQTKVMICETDKKGLTQFFSKADVSAIKNLNLDFLLRFGFNIIRGEILEAANYGVWSFHHDDEEVIRGGPPGFWEVYNKSIINGVILQQLTDSLDKGIILKKIWLPVIRHSYKAHLDQIYFESRRLPIQVCRMIQSGNYRPIASASKAPIFHPPKNYKMILFFCIMISRRIFFHLKDIFLQEDWNISLVHASADKLIENPKEYISKANWFPKKKKSIYLADPFLLEASNEIWLFAEQFDYQIGKGKLVVARSTENFTHFRPLLDHGHHFSFPFLFHFSGKIYCIPECFESDGVQLYNFDTHTGKLNYELSLLEGFRAVDPVLFEYEKRWWLMFTTKELPSVHLYAFYAESPLGPFKPHKNNPVKSDIRSARNAGALFLHKNMLLRPSQDCSGDYGRSTWINHITKLTKDVFEEDPFLHLEPDLETAYRKGLHTFNSAGKLSVIDGKRYSFTFAGFKHQLLLKLKKR